MRLKKRSKADTEISTASMPDIVFLLLFFFMVSATIKTQDEKLKVTIPKAEAITKVEKKFFIRELHVGFPKNQKLGLAPKISADGKLLELSALGNWVQEQKTSLGEAYSDQMIILLRAHEEVDMGIIGDIQSELRKNNARKILYRTLEES
ncbi:ExbD/TolR family protein [Ekhidna sp.]|uniref:ExbD/TolR family protein n=1 Tax=Ekhidna sp. TaxID=2608089 RepID=UPI003B50BA22